MNKRNIEAKRQLFHMLFGILIVILLMYGLIGKSHIFSLIIIGIIISFISKKYKILLIYWFLRNFERDRDLKKFPGKGIIFYLIGIFLVLSFFSFDMIQLVRILVSYSSGVCMHS